MTPEPADKPDLPPPDPPRDHDDGPLPAGHPVSWGAIGLGVAWPG